jgi:cytochrome c6
MERNSISNEESAMNSWMKATGARWILPALITLVLFPAASARADAEATYKAKCAGCHGPDGVGATAAGRAMKVRDFHDADVQKETDAEMTAVIANGKNKMPKYADKMKDTEIKEMVAYVRTLSKK